MTFSRLKIENQPEICCGNCSLFFRIVSPCRKYRTSQKVVSFQPLRGNSNVTSFLNYVWVLDTLSPLRWLILIKTVHMFCLFQATSRLTTYWNKRFVIVCMTLVQVFIPEKKLWMSLCTYQQPSRGPGPREPLGIGTKTFANSTYPGPIFFHKKLPLSLPWEHNLKELPNFNVIFWIFFHKSLTSEQK